MSLVVRILIVFLAAAGFGYGASQAALPERGDSRDEIIRKLGPPDGTAWTGDREVLQYPRGRVFLHGGLVHSVDMMPADAFRARQARNARESEKAAAKADRRRNEGKALRLATLADPDFRQLPADDRLAFWRQFAAEYPEISVEPTLYALSREIERQQQPTAEPPRRTGPPDAWQRSTDFRRAERAYALPCAPVYPYASRGRHRGAAARAPTVAPEPDNSLRARIYGDFEANRRAAYSQMTSRPRP